MNPTGANTMFSTTGSTATAPSPHLRNARREAKTAERERDSLRKQIEAARRELAEASVARERAEAAGVLTEAQNETLRLARHRFKQLSDRWGPIHARAEKGRERVRRLEWIES